MPRLPTALGILPAAAALAVLSGEPRQAEAAPRTHVVVIDKMKFGPVPASVRVGDRIQWVNKDMFKHTATARDKSFNIDLPPSASGITVMKRAGTFAFYCIYHPGMKGQLVVAK